MSASTKGEHIGSPLQAMMKYNPDKHHRRSIRLKEYNYSQSGAYFVTICTQNREVMFDSIEMRSMIQKWGDALPTKFPNIRIDQFMIMPNHIHGIIFIYDEPHTFVGADQCVSPHGVGADQCVCPHGGQSNTNSPTLKPDEHMGSPLRKPSLGKIIQWFKTMTTNEFIRNVKTNKLDPFNRKLWQRNYYEHIIRNETDLNNIRQYIMDNPINWEEDENNPRLLQEAQRK